MRPTPDQMNDAANTVLAMVGVIVLVVGIGGGWLLARWEKHARYVEDREADHAVATPLPLSQPIQRTAQLPIATPQTTRNEPVVIAPTINEFASLDGRDPALLRALIESLAQLVSSEELTQTAAIKIGLGIPPGSRSPRYQAARTALQTEIMRLAPPAQPHPPLRVDGSRIIPWDEDIPQQEALNA